MGQLVRIREVSDKIWLVSFMDYDLVFFDEESNKVDPAENPFMAKLLPMFLVRTYNSVVSYGRSALINTTPSGVVNRNVVAQPMIIYILL